MYDMSVFEKERFLLYRNVTSYKFDIITCDSCE